MNKEYITTFEAAKRLSVTPDAVLKWIKAGILEARRTPGGHHRISVKKIEALLEKNQIINYTSKLQQNFEYCWEFNARYKTCNEKCEDCIVFETSAKRCYKLIDLPVELSHLKLYCESSCEKCDYYKIVHLNN